MLQFWLGHHMVDQIAFNDGGHQAVDGAATPRIMGMITTITIIAIATTMIMVLLLCLPLKKIALGALLVLCFSIGLALYTGYLGFTGLA